MRLSVRVLQKIFFLISCVWFILLFKNLSDIPTVKEGGNNSPSPLLQKQLVDNNRNEDWDSLVGRQQERIESLGSFYGNENRIQIKNMKQVTKKKQRRKSNRHSGLHLDVNISGSSNKLIGNENGTEFSLRTKTTPNGITHSNSNLLPEQGYDDDDDLNRLTKRQRREIFGLRRGQKRNRRGKSRLDSSLPHLRQKPSMLLPTPVIVMGFPKAGTSSIFTFFQKQGLLSQHWYCCKEQTNPKKGGPTLMGDCLLDNLWRNKSTDIFDGCGEFDVYSEINGPRKVKHHPQLHEKKGFLLDDGSVDFDGPGKRIFFPQHFRIQELHESYPNATWILNWRDFDSWIESVLNWGTKDRLHDQFMNEYYMQGVIPSLPGSSITTTKEIMKNIYDDHHELIRNFVRRHPSHALVEVNITHENAGTVLAEAFGLNPNAWKNINKNKKSFITSLRATKQKLFSSFDFIGSSFWWILLFVELFYFGWTLGLVWT